MSRRWSRVDESEWESFKVAVPLGARGAWTVSQFQVDEQTPGLDQLVAGGRDPGLGTFTSLSHRDGPMMNDCRAEILDHYDVIDQLRDPRSRNVLVSGLGLGMIAGAALQQPHLVRLDVVEAEIDVIDLVGRHLLDEPRVTIHQGDALEVDVEGQWDVVWHDIWPTITSANLPQMDLLRSRYQARARWQGCWAEDLCQEMSSFGTGTGTGSDPRLSSLLALPWR